MNIIIVKEYELRPGKKWSVGQFAEVTYSFGSELIEGGYAKEANHLEYDKHGKVIEKREEPIKGEKRNHGNIKRSNNRRNGS